MQEALRGSHGVIFDWDGTLADTQDRNYQALCAALTPYRITVDRSWYGQHAGLPIRDLLAQLPVTTPLPLDEIIATSRATLLASTTPDTIAAIPAAVELARQARAVGLPCAVASGAAAVLVIAGLDVLGLRDLFDAVVAREDVTHGKPAPDVFLEAARRLGITPAHGLAVEDALDGFAAARQAGMRVLLVRDGHLTWPGPTT